MEVIFIGFLFITFSGFCSIFREKYGLHDPTMPTRDSIDSRVKYGNRILSLLHMITFLAGASYPLEKENIGFTCFIFSGLFLIGSHIILQFILMILSEFYVQYDIQVFNKEKFKGDARNLIKQNDIQYKKICRYNLEIDSLSKQLSEKVEKIQNLEIQCRDVKYINNTLYSRLDRISENEKKKKEFLTKLFNKIEENKTVVLEGDYITMCNLLKNLHE